MHMASILPFQSAKVIALFTTYVLIYLRALWRGFLTLLFIENKNVTNSSTESEVSSAQSVSPEDKYTSCNSGWFQFGDMCYRLGGKKKIGKLSWTQASEKCREDYNGNLVAIHSREQNDFITAFLVLSVRESVWIGLHDRVNESDYTWTDGSPTTYLQWEPWEPWEGAREVEDCVELGFRFKPGWTTGNWNDGNCDSKLQFVCQKEKGKFSKRNLDPRFCSSEVGGGWKHETSCFNFVPEKKSWAEAEEYCIQNFQGHLATIPDFAVNLFLNYILRDKEENLWIGYRIKNEREKQWSSGWQMAFENWAEGEDEFNKGSCAAREPGGKWVIRSCTKILPFLCEYSTAILPILTPRAEGSSCPELPAGWRDLGGDYCYYFDLGRKMTWYEANFLCLRRGSTLLSIHSQEEAKILHYFIKYAEDAIHIGLYRSALHDDEFVWADGSEVELTLWDANEPNTEKEQCVEVRVNNFMWNDMECTKERGYICSLLKDFSNQTTETQAPTESCFSGFSSKVLIGVIFCVLVVAILIGVIVYYFRLCERGGYDRVKKTSGTKLQSPSAMDQKPRYRSEMIVADDLYENMI